MKNISSKKKIELIRDAALAKKASDIISIDLRKLASITDYFIVVSGESSTQIGSISDNIEAELSMCGLRSSHREGRPEALWILLDYGDIVVHVFHKETRAFYNLEKLWYDAPLAKLTPNKKRKAKRKKRIKGIK